MSRLFVIFAILVVFSTGLAAQNESNDDVIDAYFKNRQWAFSNFTVVVSDSDTVAASANDTANLLIGVARTLQIPVFFGNSTAIPIPPIPEQPN